jgi:hypothetical protein
VDGRGEGGGRRGLTGCYRGRREKEEGLLVTNHSNAVIVMEIEGDGVEVFGGELGDRGRQSGRVEIGERMGTKRGWNSSSSMY